MLNLKTERSAIINLTFSVVIIIAFFASTQVQAGWKTKNWGGSYATAEAICNSSTFGYDSTICSRELIGYTHIEGSQPTAECKITHDGGTGDCATYGPLYGDSFYYLYCQTSNYSTCGVPPQPDPNKGAPDCSNPGAGNPVLINSGNKYQHETDYFGSGVMPLFVGRYYNSELKAWRFSGQGKLLVFSNQVKWISDDGKGLTFEIVRGQWSVQGRPKLSLSIKNSNWVLVDSSRTSYVFDLSGILQSKTDISGAFHSYDYSVVDELTVTRSHGGSMKYGYDTNGRIKAITVSSAGQDDELYQYEYVDDALELVTFPDLTTREYHYSGLRLTGITDERGIRYATWTYDNEGRAISSEHAAVNGNPTEKVSLAFNADGSTTVTNALNKDTTYHFTQINGANKVTKVEGHQSTDCAAANKNYTYYPEGHFASGLLKTKTDWQGVVTYFEYNDRGLEVLKVQAQGTPDEKRTITEWHPTLNLPTVVIDGSKVERYNYDAQGRLLTKMVEEY